MMDEHRQESYEQPEEYSGAPSGAERGGESQPVYPTDAEAPGPESREAEGERPSTENVAGGMEGRAAGSEPRPAAAVPPLAEASREDRLIEQRPGKVAREGAPEAERMPLFSPSETQNFRSRWDAIQVAFVDDPRHAAEQADALVAEVVKRLATVFADEKSSLERQWRRGDSVTTEDLRLLMHRYRSFFNRLLSM